MASRIEQAKELIPETDVLSLSENDPSKSNKYLLWMATQKKTGHSFEDIVGTVQSFHRRRKKLQFADIYRYTDLKTLEREILALAPSKAEKKDVSKLKSGADYFCVLDNEVCKVYSVFSYKGMKSLGKNTKWCIAANANYWKSYKRDNYIFVIHSKKDPIEKRCFLISKRQTEYCTSTYDYPYIYDKDDRSACINNVIAPDLLNLIFEEIRPILFALEGKQYSFTAKPKAPQFALSFSNKEEKVIETNKIKLDDSISYIKDNNLYHIMLYSNNEELLLNLGKDLPKALGKVEISTEYSDCFNKHYSHLIDDSTIAQFILSNSCTKKVINQQADRIKNIPDSNFRELIKNSKNKTTKLNLIKERPQHCDLIEKKDVNVSIAKFVAKHLEEKSLTKIYHLYDKKRYSYCYGNDNFTMRPTIDTLIGKADEKDIKWILEQKDCPVSLSKKLGKRKVITKKKAEEVSAILESLIEVDRPINLKEVKELLKSIVKESSK